MYSVSLEATWIYVCYKNLPEDYFKGVFSFYFVKTSVCLGTGPLIGWLGFQPASQQLRRISPTVMNLAFLHKLSLISYESLSIRRMDQLVL